MRHEISKLVWDMLILKILDSRPDGEAPTSYITRELALLDASARESFPPSPPIDGGIFGAGFVTSPRKGVWRISSEGRQHLRLAESRNSAAPTDTAPPPDVPAAGEISSQEE